MTETEITTQSYRPALRDYVGFVVATHHRRLFAWPTVLANAALIFGLPLLINSPYLAYGEVSGFFKGIGIMLFVWAVIIPAAILIPIAWNLKRNALMSGARYVRLTDRSLLVEGPGLFSELTWNNFRKAERVKGYVYLFLNGSTAHLIPDSAFDSPDVAETFLRRARQLIAQSRHTQAAASEAPVTAAPVETGLQSQPFAYTFGLHAGLYPNLFYRTLWPSALVGLAVFYGMILWQHGWGLTEADRAELLPQLIGFPVIMGVILVIVPLILAPVTWLMIRKQPSTQGTRVAALTEDRLIVHGASFHTELKLAELTRVRRTRRLMLFMTQPNCAIVVPNAAFETPEAASAFFDEASARWQAARPKPAAKTHLDGKS